MLSGNSGRVTLNWLDFSQAGPGIRGHDGWLVDTALARPKTCSGGRHFYNES